MDAALIGIDGQGTCLNRSLWSVRASSIDDDWNVLKSKLPHNQHWDVWFDWYEAVALGRTPWPEAAAVEIVSLPNGYWDQGPAFVNKKIKEILARHKRIVTATTDGELISLASPQALLAADGKIDVGPNEKLDLPTADDDLPTLPIRQQALIKTILSDIPPQSPRHLPISLENYRDELVARGVRPIVGLLRDMADVIEAAVVANDGEWLSAGIRKAFDLFSQNNATLLKHFPLDADREKRLVEIEVREDAAVGDEFVKPFREAEELLNNDDLATKDALIVVGQMRQLAEIVAYLPPSDVVPNPDHRWSEPKVSVRKRLVLQARGFYAKIVKLWEPISKLVDLAHKLSKILEMWDKFFGPGPGPQG